MNCCCLFLQIDSLAQLSPSVLTHAPVLSLNQSELTYQMVTSVWLNNQWVHYKPSLQKFIETYVPKLLEHSAKMLKGPLEGGTDRVSNQIIIREALDSVQLIDKVRTMLRLIDGSLGSFRNAGEQILERFFCFSAIWAFGGLFAKESRNMFSEWWHSTFCSSPVPIKGTVSKILRVYFSLKKNTFLLCNAFAFTSNLKLSIILKIKLHF